MISPAPLANKTRYHHAVVIGAGMAGLWAGRVLAEHFGQVTIVERDRLPDHPAHRRGVPQARHAHTLLARGYQILERLFPELDADLEAAGAPRVDWLRDCRSYLNGDWVERAPSRLITRACSRDLLEWVVRSTLASRDRVRFLEGRHVTGLVYDESIGSVTSVKLRSWGREDTDAGDDEELLADLVVDASGRDSGSPTWLAALGFGEVRETVVNPFLGYATRLYRPPGDRDVDWRAMIVSNAPPRQTRGGVIYPVEGGCWLVTLAGIARDYPPTDEAGFLAFARSLDTPALYEALSIAEPLSPIWGYRRTENRLRHYERLPRWPDGFVALGDAVCAFNPVYGQGMTASALGALALDRCLRAQRRRQPGGALRGLGRRFQRELAQCNATPWLLATGEDYRWPTTTGGRRGILTTAAHRYVDRVLGLASREPAVGRPFFEVLHLLRPPVRLFSPRILRGVLGAEIRAHRSSTPR